LKFTASFEGLGLLAQPVDAVHSCGFPCCKRVVWDGGPAEFAKSCSAPSLNIGFLEDGSDQFPYMVA
jgi:hypothetical protein